MWMFLMALEKNLSLNKSKMIDLIEMLQYCHI